MTATLLLNASFEPLKVIDWRRAMTLFYQGKVEIVEEHDQVARAVTFSFKLPSVVRLLRFVKIRRQRDLVPFTRANIYSRDAYTCQYCGKAHHSQDLTFDHVVPAAQGGHKSWTNIVTCCLECNREKGARTPQEAGMKLRRVPVKPVAGTVVHVTVGLRATPETWKDYLSFAYWNVSLEET